MSVAALTPPLLSWLSARVDGLRRVALRDFDGMGCGVAAAEALRAGARGGVSSRGWEPLAAAAAQPPRSVQRASTPSRRRWARFRAGRQCAARRRARAPEATPTPDDALPVDSPPASLDVPLLWPAELQQALLAGTSCESTCAQQAALSQVMHAALRDGDGDDGAGPSLEELRWGQSLILSRAHSGRGKPLALVPGLDLLNTGGHAAPTAEVAFADDGAFELVATRDHAPGEQLLIDYSTPTPHRMLRLYGFVPARGDGGGAATEEALLPLLPADGDGGAAAAARALEALALAAPSRCAGPTTAAPPSCCSSRARLLDAERNAPVLGAALDGRRRSATAPPRAPPSGPRLRRRGGARGRGGRRPSAARKRRCCAARWMRWRRGCADSKAAAGLGRQAFGHHPAQEDVLASLPSSRMAACLRPPAERGGAAARGREPSVQFRYSPATHASCHICARAGRAAAQLNGSVEPQPRCAERRSHLHRSPGRSARCRGSGGQAPRTAALMHLPWHAISSGLALKWA